MRINAAAFLILCLIILYAGSLAAEDAVLGSGTWVPFTGEDLPDQGTMTKLVSEAFAQVDITVRRVEMPWARVLAMNDTGEIDGGFPLGRNADREALFLYSEKIGEATRYIWHLESKPFDWTAVDDLKGLRIGIVRGAKFGPVHEELLQRIETDPSFAEIQEVTTDEQNIRKLLAGRLDVIMGEINQTHYLLDKMNIQESIVNCPRPLMASAPLYVIFPRGERGEYLQKQFNRGLAVLQNSVE